jgi:hypothetical protein
MGTFFVFCLLSQWQKVGVSFFFSTRKSFKRIYKTIVLWRPNFSHPTYVALKLIGKNNNRNGIIWMNSRLDQNRRGIRMWWRKGDWRCLEISGFVIQKNVDDCDSIQSSPSSFHWSQRPRTIILNTVIASSEERTFVTLLRIWKMEYSILQAIQNPVVLYSNLTSSGQRYFGPSGRKEFQMGTITTSRHWCSHCRIAFCWQ